jgi:hypothetical protein
MAGRCYTELRLPSLAEPLLRAATDAYDDTLMRENSLLSPVPPPTISTVMA